MSKVDESIQKYSSLLALCARFFLSLSLFWAGCFNIIGWQVQLVMLTPVAQSLAAPILASSIAAEFVLGVAILIGYMARQIALLAAVYTLTYACILHAFWDSEPGFNSNHAMNFFQSIGVAGGFFLLAAFGAGAYSADEKLKDPEKEPEAASQSKT